MTNRINNNIRTARRKKSRRRRRDSLPNRCTVAQLRKWLIDGEEVFGKYLRRSGIDAKKTIALAHELTRIQRAKRKWANRLPFPSDVQLLLMAMLFSPGQDFENFDQRGLNTMILTLVAMSRPDPIPGLVWLNVEKREIQLDRKVIVVKNRAELLDIIRSN